MKKIVCFGEVLLRMSPALQGEWLQQQQLPVYLGGAELNVAQALAQWQQPVKYVSALPVNGMSDDIKNFLANKKIAPAIIDTGDRIGIYYLPQGADLKHQAVIYDRAGSSFASLRPGQVNWDAVFADADWFHFTAISPALNEHLPAVCLEALQEARKRNLFISVDLNYRAKLWQYGKNPLSVMPELVSFCDLVMGNIWSMHSLLGVPVDEDIHQSPTDQKYLAHASKSAGFLFEQWPGVKFVANTFRFDMEQGLRYFASLDEPGKQYESPVFEVGSVVDKVGSGDCFMAGLVLGFCRDWSEQEIIRFAAKAAIGKLQERGDATNQNNAQQICAR